MPETSQPKPIASRWWSQAGTVTRVAIFLVIAAALWFLLKELAPLLRPLSMAILLCYVLLPLHSRLRKVRSNFTAIMLMSGGAIVLCAALGIIAYGSIVEFNNSVPRLSKRAADLLAQGREWSNQQLPPWVNQSADEAMLTESTGSQQMQEWGKAFLKYTADMLLEAVVVALYVIFLILEARRLPQQVREGFDNDRAKTILDTIETINDSVANYLKMKVKASFILAAPITLILLFFNVKFALIWGLLTFCCNFIPYVGTFVACGSPLLFAFLDLPFGMQPVLVAVLLLGWHAATSMFIEPILVGRAVGLSPLVILMSLTFWGICWGLVGMLLAIPLTVTLKIVLANIEQTKGFARLLGDE